jgi:hypothetical protein
MDPIDIVRAKIEGAAGHVRAYSASEANRAMVALLDALLESYKQDLIHARVDGVPRIQAAAQQVMALRATVADTSIESPSI